MNALLLENMRCFVSPGWRRIAPLTILVGENSTGKTSFLAATRLAWDLVYGRTEVDFNEDPFLLGAYDQIAHFFGGRGGRAKHFDIGMRFGDPRSAKLYVASRFEKRGSQPQLIEQSIQTPAFKAALSADASGESVRFDVDMARGESFSSSIAVGPGRAGLSTRFNWEMLPFMVTNLLRSERRQELVHEYATEIRRTIRRTRRSAGIRPYAFAPVSTKPRRTYDPTRQTPGPEGEHIPMVLARTFFTDKKRWRSLKSGLERFGKASGLFERLDVKALGRSDSDPFQLRVRISGPPANLIDVGYGVSQVLPILVEALSSPHRQTFLLQQPEIHLHPRAQAELGSFLATVAMRGSTRFLIETHSDFLIDRIRIEVRDGKKLKPSDVSILYFERCAGEVKIHELELDETGNMIRVPDHYREFFMDEERRFLGL